MLKKQSHSTNKRYTPNHLSDDVPYPRLRIKRNQYSGRWYVVLYDEQHKTAGLWTGAEDFSEAKAFVESMIPAHTHVFDSDVNYYRTSLINPQSNNALACKCGQVVRLSYFSHVTHGVLLIPVEGGGDWEWCDIPNATAEQRTRQAQIRALYPNGAFTHYGGFMNDKMAAYIAKRKLEANEFVGPADICSAISDAQEAYKAGRCAPMFVVSAAEQAKDVLTQLYRNGLIDWAEYESRWIAANNE